MMLVIEGATDGCSGLLRRCAAPWMALPKPYMDVFTGVLLNSSCDLSARYIHLT
jgi:hypothetical protein